MLSPEELKHIWKNPCDKYYVYNYIVICAQRIKIGFLSVCQHKLYLENL